MQKDVISLLGKSLFVLVTGARDFIHHGDGQISFRVSKLKCINQTDVILIKPANGNFDVLGFSLAESIPARETFSMRGLAIGNMADSITEKLKASQISQAHSASS